MNVFRGEPGPAGPIAKSNDEISLVALFQTIRRRKGIVILTTLLALSLAGAYLYLTKPTFTADALVLIDPRQLDILPGATVDPLVMREGLTIDSEIELLKSSVLLRRVASAKNIFDDADYNTPSRKSLVKKWIYTRLGRKLKSASGDKKRSIFKSFRNRVNVKRVRRTYVFKVSYKSWDRRRAMEISNAIARAYLNDKLESSFSEAKRTNEWLASRIAKLRIQVIEGDRAVELYKAKHGILDASQGRVSERQQSEIKSKLILARVELAQFDTRFKRLKLAIENKGADAAVADSLKSDVIARLRSSYADAMQKASQLRAKYGRRHQIYRSYQAEVVRIRALIVGEMKRFLDSYKNSFEMSRARVKALESGLKELKGAHVFSGQKQVELRELKRQAEAKKVLYKSLLDKQQKWNERETLPSTKARIIEQATLPTHASWPNSKLVVLIGTILGLGLGMGIAFIQEMLDKKARSQDDLEDIFPGRFLGMIPVLPLKKYRSRTIKRMGRRKAVPPEDEGKAGMLSPEVTGIYREMLVDRNCVLSEILRNVLLSIRLAHNKRSEQGAQVITFVSSMPGEGKSTVSLTQALYLAGNGNRTLLIDSDFRSPALTRLLTPVARYGLADLSPEKKTDPKQIIWHDKASRLDFLPASGSWSRAGASDRMLINGDVAKLVDKLRQHYDYIVIDVPPILILPDARVMAESIDHFVFVAEWGKIGKQDIGQAIEKSPEVAKRIIGAIYNKVDQARIKRYATAYGHYGSTTYESGYSKDRQPMV